MYKAMAAGTATNSLCLSKSQAQPLLEHLFGVSVSLIPNGSAVATYISKVDSNSIILFLNEA